MRRSPMADTGFDPPGGADEEPDPRARLMHEVAEQMDAIEAEFGDDFKIGRVITIVEVIRPNQTVEIRLRAGQFPWVALGMLEWAKKLVESRISG
jgi:hypothetical protein